MVFVPTHLAQARENSTSAVSVYSPGAGEIAQIRSIVVANTSGADASLRLFLDNDGTTYDESTALVWDAVIPAGVPFEFYTYQVMDDAAGNLAYQSSVANALTITVSGGVTS